MQEQNVQDQTVQDQVAQNLNVISPIVEHFNSIRTKALSHIKTYKDLAEFHRTNKQLCEQIQSLVVFLESIVNKPLQALEQSELLNNLADTVINNLSTIKSEEDLKSLAHKSYSEFTNLSLFVNRGEKDSTKIVQEVLITPQLRKIFFQTKANKFVGVAQLLINEEFTTVLIISDEIEVGAERPFEEKFLEKLNLYRLDQNALAGDLSEYHLKLKKTLANYKEELITDLDGFIGKLRRSKSMQMVKPNSDLGDAAREYFELLEQSNGKSFYSQDEHFLKISLSHYISGFYKCNQFVVTGTKKSDNILLELLVSDKEESRTSRKALLNPDFKFIGTHQGNIRDQSVTVIILTDRCDPTFERSFPEEFLFQLNRLRANPKTYVKYVQEIISQNSYVESRRSLRENNVTLKTLEKLVEYLKTQRSHGPFILNDDLSKACTKRAEFLKENESFTSTEEELRFFMAEYGSAFKTIGSIDDRASVGAKELVLRMLTDKSDMKTSIIFNRHLNFIGICRGVKENANLVSPSPRSSVLIDNSISVILFADKFEPAKATLKIAVHNHRRRLDRPRLTDDEKLQIIKDFKLFDTLNTGLVKPATILIFMKNIKNYATENPIYHQAWTHLNTDENNSRGVNTEEFTLAVTHVLRFFAAEDKWATIFPLFTGKKFIDFAVLKTITEELGYRLSDEEVEEILGKLHDDSRLDVDKFCEVMNIAEKSMLR